MMITSGFVGIDVSKHWLDIFNVTAGQRERIANTDEAIASLVPRLVQSGALAVFEATGIYDRRLQQGFDAAGVCYARINPGKARRFAQAAGFLAKTDRIDAVMLAALGQCLRPAAAEPLPAGRERLARLSRRRDQLVAMRQQERTRRSECRDGEPVLAFGAHLDWLDAAIAACDEAIGGMIEADESLARASRLMRSVPGVGPVSATVLLTQAPELGMRSGKTIAALAGLAPFNADSGRFRGKRKIRGGRKRLRDALYMAAVSAARSKTRLGSFYRALRNAGKPPKLALIALARKILVILNAIVRQQVPFRP